MLISKDGVVQVTYTYDDLNQIKSSTRNGATTNYDYDAGGNLLIVSVGDTRTCYITSEFSGKDQLEGYYSCTYDGKTGEQTFHFDHSITYDDIGNPLNYCGYTFTWTNGRRLATATKGTDSYSYAYDADGKRISKTVNGVTTKFHYDGDNTGDGSMC